jgi:hypothetical protein
VIEEQAIGVQRLGGDGVGVGVNSGSGAVGLPLTSMPTGLIRLGFVGSPVAQQLLDCVPGGSPYFYSVVREGPTTNSMAGAPN